MKKPYLAVLVVTCSTLLAACDSTSDQTNKQRPIVATTQEATAALQQTCLASLPNFKGLSAFAEKANMTPLGRVGPIRPAYQVPGKRLVVGIVKVPGGTACSLTVDSIENPETLGNSILASVRASTGRGKEKRFPSSFYEFAIHLPNGSLITHDLRKKGGGAYRSIFFITSPISENQISPLIYN